MKYIFFIYSLNGLLLAYFLIQIISYFNLKKAILKIRTNSIKSENIANVLSFFLLLNAYSNNNNWKFEFIDIYNGTFILSPKNNFPTTFHVILKINTSEDDTNIYFKVINFLGHNIKKSIFKYIKTRELIQLINSKYFVKII